MASYSSSYRHSHMRSCKTVSWENVLRFWSFLCVAARNHVNGVSLNILSLHLQQAGNPLVRQNLNNCLLVVE